MRATHFLLASLFVVAPQAHADLVHVPLLADGTVDLEKVLLSTNFTFPRYDDGVKYTNFTGEMLGEVFAGREISGDIAQDFTLAIDAPTLSEHGNFLIAVLATGSICNQHGLTPGMVLWRDTKDRNGATWEVSTSCSAPSD